MGGWVGADVRMGVDGWVCGCLCLLPCNQITHSYSLLRAAYCRQVDISEMFHHMGVLPTFTLHSAGLCPGATPTHFWRVYSLKTSGMTCEITETFLADVLDRPPTGVKPAMKRSSLGHNGF